MSDKTFYFILKVKLSKLEVWVEQISKKLVVVQWKWVRLLTTIHYLRTGNGSITYLLQPVKSQVLHSWICSNACSFNPSSLQGFTSPPRSSAHNVMRVRLPIPHTALQFDQRDHCISQGSTAHSSLFSADPSHDFGLVPLKK